MDSGASNSFLEFSGRRFTTVSTLPARGRASMLIQGHTPSGTIVMVSVEGSARVVDGTEAEEVNHRLRAKYIKPEALDAIDRAWNRVDDVAIEITPHKWRSWTGNIFNEETQKELDRSDGELWPYGEIWLSDD